MADREYSYIVRCLIEGESVDFHTKSYGLWSALHKAKQLYPNVTHVIPNRKNTLSTPEKYTVERIEEQINNVTV